MINIYQLKVTLEGIEPPIWRRIIVPGNLNLERLHHVIQDAMGWENDHLHSFDVKGCQYGVPDPEGRSFGPPVKSQRQYTLERLVAAADSFTYTYDFGDNWVHEILVEAVSTGAPCAPQCIAAARACPPEDCGGVWGYAELVEAIADEAHENHEEMLERVPDGWSPEDFNLEAANRLVAQHRPQPGRGRSERTTARGRQRARA